MVRAPSSVMGLSEIDRLRRQWGLEARYCARHRAPPKPMRFWPRKSVSTSACSWSARTRQCAPWSLIPQRERFRRRTRWALDTRSAKARRSTPSSPSCDPERLVLGLLGVHDGRVG